MYFHILSDMVIYCHLLSHITVSYDILIIFLVIYCHIIYIIIPCHRMHV